MSDPLIAFIAIAQLLFGLRLGYWLGSRRAEQRSDWAAFDRGMQAFDRAHREFWPSCPLYATNAATNDGLSTPTQARQTARHEGEP